MATVEVRARLTPEQYLAWERGEPEKPKHEYYDGEIVTMPGASRFHNLISANFVRLIGNHLVGRPGEVYACDMRVASDPPGAYVYPDVVAVRDEPRFFDDAFDTLLNPVLIVEVLSPSTESTDRGKKFLRFRRAETLSEYVLVSQDCVRVERFARQGDEWVLTVLERREDVLRLDSIGCDIPLSAIYAKVVFPGEEAPAGP